MSAPTNIKSQAARVAPDGLSAREAITFYNPMEEREADKAPLQLALIRRIFGYTKPLRRQAELAVPVDVHRAVCSCRRWRG